MKSRITSERIIWILNTIVISMGLYIAYDYSKYLDIARRLMSSGCCGVSLEAYYTYLLERLIKDNLGIKLDAFALYGFALLLTTSILCIVGYKYIRLLYIIMISSTIPFIAYLEYVMYTINFFCRYCLTMHILILTSFILSIIWLKINF